MLHLLASIHVHLCTECWETAEEGYPRSNNIEPLHYFHYHTFLILHVYVLMFLYGVRQGAIISEKHLFCKESNIFKLQKQVYIKIWIFTFNENLTVKTEIPKPLCYRFYFFLIFNYYNKHICGQI